MNYTFQKRRELNDAFRAYLLGETIKEEKGSMPVLWVESLPERACAVESVQDLIDLLPSDDRAWRKVVPVFVKVPRMDAKTATMEYYYLLNYVNCSEPSLEHAAELVAEGRLFWFPNKTIETNGKRNR